MLINLARGIGAEVTKVGVPDKVLRVECKTVIRWFARKKGKLVLERIDPEVIVLDCCEVDIK